MNPKSSVLYGLAALLAAVAVGLNFSSADGFAVIPFLGAALFACWGLLQSSTRLGILATTVLALGCNAYLLDGKISEATGQLGCDVNTVISCSTVNSSEYSLLFGLPVTLLGVAFYLALAVIVFRGKQDPKEIGTWAPTFYALSILANLFSLYLAGASLLIGAICVVCITIYGCNLLLWVAGKRALASAEPAVKGGLIGPLFERNGIVFGAIFVAVTAIGNTQYTAATSVPDTKEVAKRGGDALAGLYEAPRGNITLRGNEPTLGNASPKYVLVEFADYRCGHCKQAFSPLKDLVKNHPDLQLQYKYFPLSGLCNDAIPAQPGESPMSCDAAYTAECARQQGKFWEMSQQLFLNQGYFEPAQLEMMAEKTGLDMDAYAACLADPATIETVKNSAKDGVQAGVSGTPALFLMGTHGSDFIRIKGTAPQVDAILKAHRGGIALPAPRDL